VDARPVAGCLQPFALPSLTGASCFPAVNLLLAASNKPCNGAIMYTRRLASLLKSGGHRVWVAAARDSWIAGEIAGEIPLLETDFRRWPLDEVDRVAAFCRQERIGVFHSHLTRASNFGALLRLRHGIPSLAHLHANHPQLNVWFHSRLLAVSKDTLRRHRMLLAGWGAGGAVLPNFVDTGVFRPAAGRPDRLRELASLPAGTPVVVVVGKLCRRKGQDLAVRAWPRVLALHPKARLLLIGDGELPGGLLPANGVSLLGPRPDIEALLPHATVCLVPSRDEPFGLAAIEAMACGVPVVAARAGGLAEIVAGGAGRSYARGDLEGMVAAIDALLGDPVARRLQAEAGMTRVRDSYGPAAHLAALESHYADLIGQA
jgi:glycosyltransferase involved in cell wall biosynthesis